MPDETESTATEETTETTAAASEVVEETAAPAFDAEAAHQAQQATNEQMAGLLTQQSEAMQGMQTAIQDMARPAPVAAEDEFADDPTGKALADIQSQLNDIQGRATQKDNGEYVERCVSAAGVEVAKLIAKNPLTKANPALARKVYKQVVTGTRNHVAADPANRTVTAQQIQAIFSQEMQEQQAILDAQPGQKAANAATQAAVNKKSVEMPGGGSPTQEPDKKLDPDSNAYWEQKALQP